MKNKILILFIAILGMQYSYGQSSKVSTAYFLMDDYRQSKDVEDLQKAKNAIDIASKHETTSIQGKTWYYRGLVYNMLAKDESLKANGTDYTSEALVSFKKALSITDKKFKNDDKVVQLLTELSVNSFNTGVELFKTKEYKTAYTKFLATIDINKALIENNSKEPVSSTTATEYSAIAASNAGMNTEAISAYKKMIVLDKENNFYSKLANLYNKEGNADLYKQTLEEGSKAFPNDANIIISQLNILIKEGKTSEAMNKIDKAIELQPDNDMLYFVKGNTLENSGDIDGAVKLYEKAVEVNPKNDKALYNIGAVYFKQANKLIEEMNKLSMSAADTKKYEELDSERKSIYSKAKPYFEKVLELLPNDAISIRALKKINSTLSN